jgi:molybdopterin synthase sulfur carrier subunit
VSISVHLPGPLRPFNEGRSLLTLEGATTVEEALQALPPGVRDRILDEVGEIRPHVNVFVGETSVRETGGLATPVRDGAELFVIPAVSGGLIPAVSGGRPVDGPATVTTDS